LNAAAMETTLPDRLLTYLRTTLGADVGFATAPTRLSGGFDTTIVAFGLARAPPDWQGELILRLMPRADQGLRTRREAATHAALVGRGFPAPPVVATESDAVALGRPFLIMRRLPGPNMWDNAVGPNGRLARIARFTRDLARTHARLHTIAGDVLHASARRHGLDSNLFTVAGELRQQAGRIASAGLRGLEAGAAWLEKNRPPPAQDEVVCHGDFHPLNVVMDGDTLSGVIDWSQAIVAEPAFDVAATRVLLRFGDAHEPPWARWPARWLRRIPVRRYTSFYRAARAFDDRNVPYFECMRVLAALIVAGETAAGPGNPWRAPHTLTALYRHFETISGVRVAI
jgi:aminoglycoside phosphotransferase (APT) family kinase protein